MNLNQKPNYMKKHKKFLEFKGETIVFLSVDGVYWIPIKPICGLLKVNYNRTYKNTKSDPVVGPELSLQQICVTKNGKSQFRNMLCIPEKYVYGWIISLRSASPELIAYKRTCYELIRQPHLYK